MVLIFIVLRVLHEGPSHPCCLSFISLRFAGNGWSCPADAAASAQVVVAERLCVPPSYAGARGAPCPPPQARGLIVGRRISACLAPLDLASLFEEEIPNSPSHRAATYSGHDHSQTSQHCDPVAQHQNHLASCLSCSYNPNNKWAKRRKVGG